MRKKLLKKIISQEDGTAQILEFLLSSARRTLVHLYKAGNAQYSHIDAGILLVALGFMGKRSFSFVSGTDSSPSEGVTKCCIKSPNTNTATTATTEKAHNL
ncbi:hypothetical protein EYZ11_009195 [Aspergillus tanneri]|uniref:Uncharacterized protein n=1 Tax=Aspergillus tanneri TaxID=1220188 RepID=A0A4S3J8N9_9EURO|nr:hypothetical protein EYZ11_009195 [Aspergillus tanneri]